MRLFVSYAHVDMLVCKQIVSHLEAVHEVWYDRRLHPGMEWQNEIQERIEWCEGFVYLLSSESIASEYCRQEFTWASKSHKHIIPVLIQANTVIPDDINHIQYADLSAGIENITTLLNAITYLIENSKMAILRIKRKKQFRGFEGDIKLFLDDVEIGRTSMDDIHTYEIYPGIHKLQAQFHIVDYDYAGPHGVRVRYQVPKVRTQKGDSIIVKFEGGREYEFVCGFDSNALKTIWGYLSFNVKRGPYIKQLKLE